MTVRKYSKTTMSLLIIILVLLFFSKKLIEWKFSYDLIVLFLKKIYDYEHLGIWTVLVMKLSVFLIIITGFLNVVVRESVGFEVFYSLRVPIVMCFSLVIAVYLPINNNLFWIIVYIVNIFSVVWSYIISFENCFKYERDIFTFMFEIKEGKTKQNVDKIDLIVFYILTKVLSICFWILFIFFLRYVLLIKS